MEANREAQGALESYLGMKAPGYALMIDAPWGAGKTHFVRTVCQVGPKRHDVRYVSLNGVSDEVAFRRALLKDSLDIAIVDGAESSANTLFRWLNLGELGSFAREILEERLAAALPDTLIFDDIERSSISPPILFGLINDFVEHKGKRVILVVHSEEHVQKDDFLRRKEKLVGRTIPVVADFDSAFIEFLSSIDSGRSKTYLDQHREILSSVFDESGHQNLRLMRNAARDCAMLLERVDEDLFLAKEPMARFVKTFLALTMALAKGDLSLALLDQRDNWKIAASSDVEDELKPLNVLLNRHRGADIYAHSGAALSKTLAYLLFVKGFADDLTLNRLLRTTGQFEPQDENPLWLRMLYWTRLEWNKLLDLIDEGNAYLFETSSVAAGPYLHISFCMLWIEERGGLEISRSELKKNILERIETLAESGGIPAAQLGIKFGWDRRGSQFSFGGHAVDACDDHCDIMKAMASAQLRKFHNDIKTDADNLLDCYQADLAQFLRLVSYTQDSTSYYHFPIFKFINLEYFATTTIGHLQLGRGEEVGAIFKKIAERHSDPKGWEDERLWFTTLREALEHRAAAHSRLAAAQLEQFFKWYWKFAPPEDGPTEIGRD